MTVVKTAEAVTKTAREFIGKAWVNTTKDGRTYLQLTLDQDIAKVELMKGQKIQLWPNNKREGKNDADYRASVV